MTVFKEYLRGYSHACLGGRPKADGLLLMLLQWLRGSGDQEAVAHALGIQDGVRDQPMKERVVVEAEVARLLAGSA